MEELLSRLSFGLYKQDVPKAFLAQVAHFLQKGYIKEDGAYYRVNSIYRFGTVSLQSDGGAAMQPFGEMLGVVHIAPEDLGNAKDGDIVVVRRYIAKKGAPFAKVLEILGQKERYAIAVIIQKEGKKQLVDLHTLYPIGVAYDLEWIDKHKEGDLFLIAYHSQEIKEHIGNIKDPKVDEAIVLMQYNKHDRFSKEVLDALEGVEELGAKDLKGRVDLRSLAFCTIDPVTAKDFDDAIYWDAKRFTLYVAIADVSYYVAAGSALDEEALYRGFSIYLPHRSIPMLPRVLSEGLCSLQPGVDRLAYVFEMKLDAKSLEVESSKLYEAVIHSKRRFNYDEVDALFAHKLKADTKDEAEIFIYLRQLYELTKRLRAKRLAKGFDFHSEEIAMQLDLQTNLLATTIEQQTPSHSLIEECMLLANKEAAARYERGIFRIHEEPSQSKLESLYSELAAIGIDIEIKPTTKETIEAIQAKAKEAGILEDVDRLIIRAQMQARYASVNMGHFGLGFERYTHFTSPIRRYADLLVHRELKAIAKQEKIQERYILRNLDAICARVSKLEREADSVEKEYMRRKFARWALEHIGKEFSAKVYATIPEYKAELDDSIKGATLHIRHSRELYLFEKIRVRIAEVDIYSAKIFAELVE